MNGFLKEFDSEVAEILEADLVRQQENIVLIPSENFASRAVMEAQGSIMANKYAEGYPGKRFYNGCKYMDEIESLAIERAKELFGAEHANVQPHAGVQANMSAYFALLEPGEMILAMKIDHGGHLSHGIPHNASGTFYNAVFYGVDRKTEMINLNAVRNLAKKHKPKLILVGASAYPRKIDFKSWREIADEVGAYLMADIAHIAGLIVAGVHPDPVPYCDVVTTTSHKTLRGPRGATILCKKEHAKKIDRAVFPGNQGGPFMHSIAAKAVAFKEAMKPEFKNYQEQIVKNAKALANVLMEHDFRLVSGGTDNHLMLVDLTNKSMTGKKAADLLEEAGIITNKNIIPYDTRSPFVTSGIRPGTPAVTTRGMKEPEMEQIAQFISDVLHSPKVDMIRTQVRYLVRDLCKRFPLYQDLHYFRKP